MDWSAVLNAPIGELLARRKINPPDRESARPTVGATLCCAGLRMTVQAGMSDDLWAWLVQLGWREIRPLENRLHFTPLSTQMVTRLFDAPPTERDRVLLAAIRNAASTGSITRVVVPRRTPSSVT